MRLLEILFYLLKSSSKTTIRQLSEMYNVSEKTIQRDLDKLSVIGIPIITYRGAKGGVELDKNYIIAKYVLTESDYKSLIFALYISENIMKDIKNIDLIEKFRLVDYDRCTDILEKLYERFIVDIYENKITTDSNVYKIIDNSLEKKSFINIEVEGIIIEVFPISYILKKEGLYLYYYDKDYRIILIDRISSASECEKYYDGTITKYNDNKEKVKQFSINDYNTNESN